MAAERKPRILVVEDHQDTRDLLVTHFTQQEGYEVIAVANGPEALQCCLDSETGPHLVLLDIILSYAEESGSRCNGVHAHDFPTRANCLPLRLHFPVEFLGQRRSEGARVDGRLGGIAVTDRDDRSVC